MFLQKRFEYIIPVEIDRLVMIRKSYEMITEDLVLSF